jgi:hypothetical protein
MLRRSRTQQRPLTTIGNKTESRQAAKAIGLAVYPAIRECYAAVRRRRAIAPMPARPESSSHAAAGSGTAVTPTGAPTSPVPKPPIPSGTPICVAKNSPLGSVIELPPFFELPLIKLAGVMPPATVMSKLIGPERFGGLAPFPQPVQPIAYSQ